MNYLGDFAEDETVYIPFNTFTSDDPQASATITNLADADIMVHKDGSTTQIATDGATVAIDFDTITGNHLITIDTSVDAAYSTGSDYLVRIEGTTVDGGTINAWVGHFSIQNRYMRGTDSAATATALATVDTNVDAILVDTSTTLQAELDAIQAAVITNAAGVDIAADIIALKAETATILADTNELQTDWVNGGRLDLILDTVAADTTTDIPALIATAQADLDIITGANGAVLAATQPNSLSLQPITITAGDAIANITFAGSGTEDGLKWTRTGSGAPFDANFIGQINATVDTALTDYDAATGTELAATEAKIDIIDANVDLALADTNELQTDWVNGGRLDLILDARASQATADAIEVDTQDIQTKIGVPVTSVSVDISDVQTTVDAIEVDTQDLQSRTPAALVGGRTDANVGAISGSVPAADNLEASALSIVVGLCEGTPSTTVIQTNLAETTDDHYIGRIVIFTSGAAAYQATDITDYTGATGTITVTTLTTAPAATDPFVIL